MRVQNGRERLGKSYKKGRDTIFGSGKVTLEVAPITLIVMGATSYDYCDGVLFLHPPHNEVGAGDCPRLSK